MCTGPKRFAPPTPSTRRSCYGSKRVLKKLFMYPCGSLQKSGTLIRTPSSTASNMRMPTRGNCHVSSLTSLLVAVQMSSSWSKETAIFLVRREPALCSRVAAKPVRFNCRLFWATVSIKDSRAMPRMDLGLFLHRDYMMVRRKEQQPPRKTQTPADIV